MVAIFKMSAKTHQSATISTKIDDLEDFRPEECDSDKCDLKMVAMFHHPKHDIRAIPLNSMEVC
jgi:hypothetical protein